MPEKINKIIRARTNEILKNQMSDLKNLVKNLERANNFKLDPNLFYFKKDKAMVKLLNKEIGLSKARAEIILERIQEN